MPKQVQAASDAAPPLPSTPAGCEAAPQAPVVHLNGSGADALIDQNSAVVASLLDAEAALQVAAPNARDYYPTPGAWEVALAQHRSRLARLQSVRAELDAIMIAVADQRDARKAVRR